MESKKSITVDGQEYMLKSEISNNKPAQKNKKGMTYCLVRTYSAGVFAGFIDRTVKGKENTVFNARRIWYWKGAASLSQLAIDGTNAPNECKFAKEVSEVDLKEIIEVLPCTEKARKNIVEVKEWSM